MAIKTEIGFTTPDTIWVRGKNLSTEIIGKYDFVDMIYWVTFGRLPEQREKNMVNMLLVTAADHGLTPSALSARLTYLGAPESLQGAVAAGLLGAGSNFLGTVQNVADMLTKEAATLADDADDTTVRARASDMIREYRAVKRSISGIGHPIHVNGDPRVPTLLAVSKENGYFGKHWRLALAITEIFKSEYQRTLPLNAAGGIGAILADMGLDPLFGRGLALIGRASGLVAHVIEERSAPTGQQIWDLVLAQDSRNVAPEAQRA
jgi:citrate synthase